MEVRKEVLKMADSSPRGVMDLWRSRDIRNWLNCFLSLFSRFYTQKLPYIM